MLVVRRQGLDVSKAELLEFLADKVAKWWLPDDILFVSELPHTATGKLQKMKLRGMYGGHKLADGWKDNGATAHARPSGSVGNSND